MTQEKPKAGVRAPCSGTMPIDIVLAGCGTVGAELLRQISSQEQRLAGDGITIRVVAIANSKRMLVESGGIDLSRWAAALASSNAVSDMDALIVLGSSLDNPVLVDCTASDTVPRTYPAFLAAGFHVVTPNKRGNTGSMESYRALRRLAREHRRRYLYEATVGAGLPVIDNLANLFLAGDQLVSFSGILSGSLSFLFGRLEDGIPFSAIVREAMERGFTEPDPRDDLSGLDVARKVLILAREAGLSLELDDIGLAGLVPPEYMAIDKAEFIARMPELDEHFTGMRAQAARDGKVLRFAGSIEGGKGRAGLVAVGPGDPLFAVKGGENALAFKTRYYDPVPLVVRGYGAGATVTAAGIFGDLLRTLIWNGEA